MTTQLQPGDTLVYRPSNWLGSAIAIKTWSPWSHVEMAVAPGKVIAARQEGVAYYPTRWDHLGMVVRPPKEFDLKRGLNWFDNYANGQKYDYFGVLLRFFTLGKQSTDRQFCSEALTRVYRNGGLPGLFAGLDADLVPPGYYATLIIGYGFTKVWSDEFK